MGVTWAMPLLRQGHPEPFAQPTWWYGFKRLPEQHGTHCSALVCNGGEVL